MEGMAWNLFRHAPPRVRRAGRSALPCGCALVLACSSGGAPDDDDSSGAGGDGGRNAMAGTAGMAGTARGGTAGAGGSGIGGAVAGAAGTTTTSGGTAGVSTGGTPSGGNGGSTGGVAGSGTAGTGSGGAPMGGAAGDSPLAGQGGAAGGGGVANAGAGGSAGSSSGSGGGSGNPDLLVPAQGALLGAYVGTGTWAQFETLLGRSVPIAHQFFGFNDNWVTTAQTELGRGKIPLITWEPWTNGSVGIALDEIINGTHDQTIQARATASKNLGGRFFLRWGHEMNGNWYPWDGSHNGANAAAAQKYIAAYRHIHDLFTSAGATNVLWVFCPNVDSVPGDAWNQWSAYYPGDEYVDWMGFDGYNWGTVQSGSTWRTFPAMVSAIYASLAAKNKPIMIPETASAEQGGDKAAWIAGILPALQNSFPGIKAFVWFETNKETDWRVESSSGARQSFITLANAAYMNP
jgi:beta-mannanase